MALRCDTVHPVGKAAALTAQLSGYSIAVSDGPLRLTLPNGSTVTEGDAVLRLLSAEWVAPTAEADEWLTFVSAKLQGDLTFVIMPLVDRVAACGPAFNALHPRQRELAVMPKAWRSALQNLKTVDAHLASSAFLAGDAVSVADVALACWVDALYTARDRISVASPEDIDGLANLKRWYLSCAALPTLAGSLTTTLQEGVVPAGAKKKKTKQQQKGQKGQKGKKQGGGAAKKKTTRAPLSLPTPLSTAGGIAFEGVFRRTRMRVMDALVKREALIADATEITMCGWARSVRKARKDTLIFVELSDGSCAHTLQCVLESFIYRYILKRILLTI